MKTIKLLNDEGEIGTAKIIKIWDKVNEVIRSYNELVLSLKPSAHHPKENKGYENAPLTKEEIKSLGQHNTISNDPNDK